MDMVEKTRRDVRKNVVTQLLNVYDGDTCGLTHEQRAVKYNKMSKSPFHFYRGSAFLFYYDLTQLPLPYDVQKDFPAWIQGDLHFENFGAFKANDGQIVFDTNDFDEGHPGSYLYDVIRNAVSIGLYADLAGYSGSDQASLIYEYVHAYAEQINAFKKDDRDPRFKLYTKDETEGAVRELLAEVEGTDPRDALFSMTQVVGGHRIFKRENGLESLGDEEREDLEEAWKDYIETLEEEHKKRKGYFKIKDVVKLFGAGIGSVGLNRYFILVEGEDPANSEDDIILEAKEARPPATSYFFDTPEILRGKEGVHQGRRVVMTQKAMHHLEDPYLGWITVQGHHYYIRENSPYNEELDPDRLKDFEEFLATVKTMGRVTAKIHARADGDLFEVIDYQNEQMISEAIGADLDRFASDLTRWATHYKKRVDLDHELFTEWVEEKFS